MASHSWLCDKLPDHYPSEGTPEDWVQRGDHRLLPRSALASGPRDSPLVNPLVPAIAFYT